jgi:DNA-binding transcriptional LysR family regulator
MRFHKLDINLLIVLHYLIQGKSVNETAQLLQLTQPAVSNALARLRDHFQEPLFVTRGRRLDPTPFAKSLAASVASTVCEIERIICSRSDFDPKTSARTFTLLCSDYVHSVFITHLVRELEEISPNVRLTVLLISHSAMTMLDDSRADFLIAPSPMTYPAYPRVQLFSDTFSCIAWTGNELVGEKLTRETYFKVGHVDVALGLFPAKLFEPVTEPLDTNRRPKPTILVPTFNAVGDTVVGTNYIAHVQTRLANKLAEHLPLRVLELPIPTEPVVEFLQWHRNKEQDAGTIWLKEQIVRVATRL